MDTASKNNKGMSTIAENMNFLNKRDYEDILSRSDIEDQDEIVKKVMDKTSFHIGNIERSKPTNIK
jgi:hypothetical protein